MQTETAKPPEAECKNNITLPISVFPLVYSCKIWMGNCLYCPPASAYLTDVILIFSSTVDCGVPPNRMFKPRMQLILYSMEIKIYYINNANKCFFKHYIE